MAELALLVLLGLVGHHGDLLRLAVLDDLGGHNGAGDGGGADDGIGLAAHHGQDLVELDAVAGRGVELLDKDDVSKVKLRCTNFLLTPETPYETTGFVNNVVFPCSALCDAETGRIAIYYGGADTVVGLAFTETNRVMDYIKKYGR